MKKIAIFGVPRSGTSWLSQIFNSHPGVAMRFQPLFSYGHKGALSERSSGEEIERFFDAILQSQDRFALMQAEMHKSYPVFDKAETPTHVAFKEMRYLNIVENMLRRCPEVKVVGIVRNPLACLASWIRAPKEFDPAWDVLSEWRSAPGKNRGREEEYFGYDKWRRVAEDFLRFEQQFPEQFRLVRYDRLLADPVAVSAGLLEFCGLAMHPQVESFIEASRSSHDSDPYSVFRARANDAQWRDVLPEEIIRAVRQDLAGSPLQVFLSE